MNFDRTINFHRLRRMECRFCQHQWHCNDAWIDRWEQGNESCPSCGTTCESENRADFISEADDPAYDENFTRTAFWYHTSTHENWPNQAYDPASFLSDEAKARMRTMGPPRAIEKWAMRQKTKALHLGTYEAAIENMLRRMANQGSAGEQLFLYRVVLKPSCVVAPGVHTEPTSIMGDVQLKELVSSDTQIYRYVNVHEDRGSVSLAIQAQAIQAVQKIAIPLQPLENNSSLEPTRNRMLTATREPLPQAELLLGRFRLKPIDLAEAEAQAIGAEMAERLPQGIRDRFLRACSADYRANGAEKYVDRIVGMQELVTKPEFILDALDNQQWHKMARRG